MKKKLKILITGPVPPPAGGISIHIWRLKHLLEDVFEIDFIDEASSKKSGFYNFRSLNIFTYLKKIFRADVLYIHSGNRLFKKIHIITGRLFAKKIIITLHGYGPRRKMPFRAIDSMIFNLANKIILVNPDIAHKLSLPSHKCIVKHAFLPPVMKDEPELPRLISDWLDKAQAGHKMIICANASRLDMHNNQDLYGLDMCIEIMKRMIEKKLPVSFVYTVSALEGTADTFNKNLQLISELGLQDHFLLINERLSFVKLIERADIVLRPTNADGDALTVREAIFLGKNTLASDVVERPAGTLLFTTRDIADLENKLEKLVRAGKSPLVSLRADGIGANEDFHHFYTGLINNVALK